MIRGAANNVDEFLRKQTEEMGLKGGSRKRRAAGKTRKQAPKHLKEVLHGLPKNIKFMGFYTRKQAEKMLHRRH